jgi:hypothetical protein
LESLHVLTITSSFLWMSLLVLCCSKDAWVEVRIPFTAFAMTFQGQLVGQRHWLPHDRVMSLGIAVSMLAPQQQQQQAAVIASSSTSSSSGPDGSTSVQYNAATSSEAVPAAATVSGPGGPKVVAGGKGSEFASSSSSSVGASRAVDGFRETNEVVGEQVVDEEESLGFDFCLEIQEIRAEVG